MDDLLDMRGITKRFVGTKALDGVDFHVLKSEIHALMGENGAGKSTLIKVLARALDVSAKLLVLDEPTSSLDSGEVARLFDVMRQLCQQGMGIVFVTHFLDQVYAVSDRITVLRNGKLVGQYETPKLGRRELVA